MLPILEIIGFVSGITGVWLTIRKNIWCFPVGIINVLITAYLVFSKTLFADTLQQLVYFVLLVIGWIKWNRVSAQSQVPVSTLETEKILPLSIIFIGGSAVMGYLFKNYSSASYPYWDSAATVICFIAQWLIARRKIENWILWMIANPMYITMYILKDLNWYAVLSGIYFIMAMMGWMEWKKNLKPAEHAG